MAYIIDLKTHTDARGSLNSIDRVLPFDIKRLYYIYNVSEDLTRGGHRHFETQEGLICMHGSFTVMIDNGRTKTEYLLDTPAKVLLMEIGDWHVMYNLSPDAVLMGMASTNYDPKDYAYEPLSLTKLMIPYENLKRLNAPFEDEFREKFETVINIGNYILGPELEKFEKEYAAWHNINYCVGISNGLDALILALKACNLPEGSEVLVPSNTYIASILAILGCQMIPVLVEPSLATYNIDPNKIEEAITLKTKAIMVVHLYGKCCQMDKIIAIKEKHNLFLIEDCAQAHGATFKGQLSGTFGEFGAFSFYPTKNLGALGDAGAVICRDEKHRNHLAQLRNYGSERKYYNDIIGYNNRLDDMQAAFLSVKLLRLKEMNAHRNKLAQLYFDNLNDNFILPVQDADFYDVYHIFNLRHPKRDELQAYLANKGIGTVIHYPVPPHKQKALAGVSGIKSEYPVATEIHDTTLSIPCSFSHTEDEIAQVIEALNNFLRMQKVDIAIAGSGIACTATLIEVFRKLINDGGPKVSITVFEKSHEFWYGIPYGSRSSVNALTITSVYDFFTAENERKQFFAWFKENKQWLLEHYLANGGLTAKQWMERNGKALDDEDFKSVYLPRYWCGKYTQRKFDSLLATVETKGLVELNLIKAEVIDVLPKGGGFEVSYELPDNAVLKLGAAKVLIATGSAPVKDVVLPEPGSAVTLINNLYEPRVDENIKRITAVLRSAKGAEERNVLMIGSNASSIEFMYLLAGLPEITDRINKLVVVSRSGLFPYHIIDKTLDSYPTPNLDTLKEAGSYDIKALIAAAMDDLKIAVKNGVIIPYIDRLIGYTIELLQPLDEEAKKRFLGIYGMQLSNQFRRSGKDYKGGETFLLEIQKLTMLKGGFDNIDADGTLHYTDTDTQQQEIYPDKFAIAINCTGANDLAQSSSRLIYNLVHNDIAKVNLSGKGFYVNEHFEAAPNLYVMGPLLGGNKNERIHFWHLENASRIMYLAPYLAEELTSSVH